MLIDNSFQQCTPEWLQARLGVVTASCLGDVVTGATCKPAAGQRAYAYRLVAERILGEPLDAYQSLAMFQGSAFEEESRATYQLISGNQVQRVGMILLDESRRVGASPDGLIRNMNKIDMLTIPYYSGGLELKNVSPHTQVEYLFSGGIPAKYRPQVYGSLYISGLDRWHFCSCSPGLPPHIVEVRNTDEDYLRYSEALDKEIKKFLALIDEIYARVTSE